MKSIWKPFVVLSTALLIAGPLRFELSAAADDGKGKGHPTPAGAFEVYPTGVAATDIANVQNAVDKHKKVVLKATDASGHRLAFNFDDNDLSTRGKVTIKSEVQVVGVGVDADGHPLTKIRGGLVPLVIDAPGADVKISGLWFEGSVMYSILPIEGHDLVIKENTFTAGVPFNIMSPSGLTFWWRGVIDTINLNPYWPPVDPYGCHFHDMLLRGNTVDFVGEDQYGKPTMPQIPSDFNAGDDNGFEIVGCTFTSLEISNNNIKNQSEPIEVWQNNAPCNDAAVPCSKDNGPIVIHRNRLVVGGDANPRGWGDPFGLVCENNEGSSLEISGNDVLVRNNPTSEVSLTMGGSGMAVSHITADVPISVEKNTIDVEGGAFAMLLGSPGDSDAGWPGGASLSGAVIANNQMKGLVDVALLAVNTGAFVNTSANNLFIENDASCLEVRENILPVPICHTLLDVSTSDNVFQDNADLPLDCDVLSLLGQPTTNRVESAAATGICR